MESEKKKFKCSYVLKGMFRSKVMGDTIEEIYEMLELKDVVSGPIDGLSEEEIIRKIIEDSEKTTGRLAIYKLDENFDPETAEEYEDEYKVCKIDR